MRRRLASRRSQTLELAEELPVHLLYFTAFVGDGGRVQFRRDVYGYDAAHREALRRKGWAG